MNAIPRLDVAALVLPDLLDYDFLSSSRGGKATSVPLTEMPSSMVMFIPSPFS